MNSEPAPSASDAQTGTAREALVQWAHLTALFSFAVVQPLLDILKGDPTFFIARRSQAVDIAAVGLGLALSAPLLLIAIELAAGLLSKALRRALHLGLVGALIALVLLPPLKGIGDSSAIVISIATVAGGLGALAYARLEPVRSFLTILSPAPLIFAGLFFTAPSIAKLFGFGQSQPTLEHEVKSDTTLVFVILDELPSTSLVNAAWEIDPLLFPNFARLASKSTWFRNATTNHNYSPYAVPGILTGTMPSDPDLLPLAIDHPHNLFTLLANSYRMNVWETFTGLWPEAKGAEQSASSSVGKRLMTLGVDLAVVYGHIVLPEEMSAWLPGIDVTWGSFVAKDPDDGPTERSSPDSQAEKNANRGKKTKPLGATERYEDRTDVVRGFIDSIDSNERPSLHFLHIVMPHAPWIRLATGQRYTATDRWTAGRERQVWCLDEEIVAQNFQRHLLQVGHADQLLGELIDRLEDQGLYDSCALVLVADHGMAFVPGQPTRSGPESTETLREVMHVPMFVKLPFQKDGRTDDRNVQAMDVLPTTAAALGIELPWEVDGHSAFDAERPQLDEKTMYLLHAEDPAIAPGKMPTRWAALDDKLRLFGAAPGWEGVYALGPHPEWIGRPVQELEVLAGSRLQLDLIDAYRYSDVDPQAQDLPAYVRGEITRNLRGRESGANGTELPTEVVVAVNGTIRAVTRTHNRLPERTLFSALIPPDALRQGNNSIEAYGIIDGHKLLPIPDVYCELDGDRILASDGRVFDIGPSTLEQSTVHAFHRPEGLQILGWAADYDAGRTADGVFIFVDGNFAITGPMNQRRDDPKYRFPKKKFHLGFRYLLSADIPPEEVAQRVRVFAFLDSMATEFKWN